MAEQRLFDAFLRQDTGPTVAWLEAGNDPEVRDKDGLTLLHWTGWFCDIEVARMLLDRGVDVDIPAPNGVTPIMQAAGIAYVPMVDFLLDNGADVKAVTNINGTALHWMNGAKGDHAVLARILDAGADPLAAMNDPEHYDHGSLPPAAAPDLRRDGLRGRHRAARRHQAVDPGRAHARQEIAALNGLEGKGYKLGDCLALP